MKRIEDLVPKHKFDFSGLEELKELSDEEYAIEIEPYLERIVENPTRNEVFDETNIEAEDFLQEMRYNREK